MQRGRFHSRCMNAETVILQSKSDLKKMPRNKCKNKRVLPAFTHCSWYGPYIHKKHSHLLSREIPSESVSTLLAYFCCKGRLCNRIQTRNKLFRAFKMSVSMETLYISRSVSKMWLDINLHDFKAKEIFS